MITYIDRDNLVSNRSIDIPISLSGMTMVVATSSFVIGKDTYEISEDEEIDITPPEVPTSYLVWLVQEIDSGDVRVLLDKENQYEGRYNFRSGRFKILHQLAYFSLEPSVDDLDQIEIRVHRFLPVMEQRERRGL